MLTSLSKIPAGVTRMAGFVLLLIGLAYPFAVYFGIEHLSPRIFAALLCALWLTSLLSNGGAASRWPAGIALLFFLLLGLLYHARLPRWYPITETRCGGKGV